MEKAIIKTKDGHKFEGILMPSRDKKITVIKLNNGYNIGIKNININSVKKEKTGGKTGTKQEKIKQKENLPEIMIIHTGGTIASKVDYETGAVKPQFEPFELLRMFPELKDMAKIKTKLLGNIFSENIRLEHYNLMIDTIKEQAKDKNIKGIVITHGTDTLHYSSAAMAFALENINIPVVFVGSQRSSDRGSSDSFLNLISAVSFIVNTNYNGVMICMHSSIEDKNALILNGVNARKLHSSRRDAFKAVNIKPIAIVNYEEKKIKIITKKTNSKGKLTVKKYNPKLKVGIVRSYPHMNSDVLKNYKDYDGLILEGTGLGHFPIIEYDKYTKENSKIKETLKELCKKTPVFMTTQAVFGRINMGVYSAGRELQELGVLGNYSTMCTETAYIKLCYLLSNYSKEKAKELMLKNLRGEITERDEV
ncbi:Glu-tRNA(Gln) amidotransferase subunit GatD [Candidatus Woesearchaeota archaeon]|nr:Glu-tRNA(Gln) amidotransferase subunit GatD [Candidatus Woesearchaeota archaeon]